MFRKATRPQAWPSTQGRPDSLQGDWARFRISALWSPSCCRTKTASLSSVGLPGEVWTKISPANAKLESLGSHLGFQAILKASSGTENQLKKMRLSFISLPRPFGWVSACLLALAWGREGCAIGIKKAPLAPLRSSVLCLISILRPIMWPLAPVPAPDRNLSIGYLVVSC